jgi:glucose-fructose oxidoreductase
LDYLGYGTTLGTWFMNGRAPIEVTAVTDRPAGLEVDEHAIVIARYASGLSKFETRWGTFTDPWTIQPQPICGFTFIGSDGTLASPDYATHLMLQTRARPDVHPLVVEPLARGRRNAIEYLLDCITRDQAVTGPLDPAVSLLGQRIVDTAARAAAEKRTLPLVD